jgi:translation initiation factor IF-2
MNVLKTTWLIILREGFASKHDLIILGSDDRPVVVKMANGTSKKSLHRGPGRPKKNAPSANLGYTKRLSNHRHALDGTDEANSVEYEGRQGHKRKRSEAMLDVDFGMDEMENQGDEATVYTPVASEESSAEMEYVEGEEEQVSVVRRRRRRKAKGWRHGKKTHRY